MRVGVVRLLTRPRVCIVPHRPSRPTLYTLLYSAWSAGTDVGGEEVGGGSFYGGASSPILS